MDAAIAHVQPTDTGGFEICVNFGVLAGRQATPAELEVLGRELVDEAGGASVVAEERFELSAHSEAELQQVRIELDARSLDETMRGRVVAIAERWARECAAERHAGVTDL
jgi:hypothetical protein